MVKYEYRQRILDKQKIVESQKQTIEKLAKKEKTALFSLRDTLSLENQFDRQLEYDINGCPKQKDFSEKNHKSVFQNNFRKSKLIK